MSCKQSVFIRMLSKSKQKEIEYHLRKFGLSEENIELAMASKLNELKGILKRHNPAATCYYISEN
ncbi:hypothetical protein F9U64_14450 [Gracilibacillus oryzae]|uniref:Uncharacterized protein n=1 Tax=Gracilibacillus oryzae TaxID=1672701 RepID=A0A7C8GS98_9BACI|nr:hypothetical protein [Gracilibacillus oryzae]KAB8130108.1 hypothetical protein F9U64_14450 [Gracilibacillus oryzae]